jgi:hypothetical protein
MRALPVAGLVVLGLGLLSLFVPIPRSQHDGFRAGGVSIGIETHHEDKVAPIVSGALIVGGAALLIAGKARGR